MEWARLRRKDEIIVVFYVAVNLTTEKFQLKMWCVINCVGNISWSYLNVHSSKRSYKLKMWRSNWIFDPFTALHSRALNFNRNGIIWQSTAQPLHPISNPIFIASLKEKWWFEFLEFNRKIISSYYVIIGHIIPLMKGRVKWKSWNLFVYLFSTRSYILQYCCMLWMRCAHKRLHIIE